MKRPVSETRAESFVAKVNKKFVKAADPERYQYPETVDAALGLIAMVADAHWTEGHDRTLNAAFQSYLSLGEMKSFSAVAIDPRSGVVDPERYRGGNLSTALTATANRAAQLIKNKIDNGSAQEAEATLHEPDVDTSDSRTADRVTEELETLFVSQTIHDSIITLYEQEIIDRKQAEGLLVLLEEADISGLDRAAVLSVKATARLNLRSKINQAKNVSVPLLDKIVGDANNGIAPKDINQVVGKEVIKRGAMNKDVEKIVRGTLANELTRLFRESSDLF